MLMGACVRALISMRATWRAMQWDAARAWRKLDHAQGNNLDMSANVSKCTALAPNSRWHKVGTVRSEQTSRRHRAQGGVLTRIRFCCTRAELQQVKLSSPLQPQASKCKLQISVSACRCW